MKTETIAEKDICVCCGAPVPEGRMVCRECETNPTRIVHSTKSVKQSNKKERKED